MARIRRAFKLEPCLQSKRLTAMTYDVEWITSSGLVDYCEAEAFMERRVQQIVQGKSSEAIWLLEHPPTYTAGTSARKEDLLSANRFPVYSTKRGGQYTYHGPGQRVIYVMLDLNRRGRDVRVLTQVRVCWLSVQWWSRRAGPLTR